MKKYTGTYICPHCEEKFAWEYIDNGYRHGMGEYVSEVITHDENHSVAKCSLSTSRNPEYRALSCYCTHCQMPVEIEDIDDILKE